MALERSSYSSRADGKPIIAAEVPRLTKKAHSSIPFPPRIIAKPIIARRDTWLGKEGRALWRGVTAICNEGR
ncbi:MAG: hypothetical protein ACREDT_12875 [Methylocella sp.]